MSAESHVVPLDAFSRLSVSATDVPIRIAGGDTYGLELRNCPPDLFDIRQMRENHEVEIAQRGWACLERWEQIKKGFLVSILSWRRPLVVITIPEGEILRDLHVRVTTGSVHVNNIYTHTLEIDLVTGSAKLEKVACNISRLKCVTGSITANFFVNSEQCHAVVETGSINFRHVSPQIESYRVECYTGNITMPPYCRFGKGSPEKKSGGFPFYDLVCRTGSIKIS